MLYLLVQSNGSKIWRFAYRFNGKQKLLSGGPYPQTTLVAARAWRKKMKHQLALGLDPSVERQNELEAGTVEKGGSFEQVAREWLLTRTLAWVPAMMEWGKLGRYAKGIEEQLGRRMVEYGANGVKGEAIVDRPHMPASSTLIPSEDLATSSPGRWVRAGPSGRYALRGVGGWTRESWLLAPPRV